MPRPAPSDDVLRATFSALDIEPLEPYPGARPKWKCRCLRCGSFITPRWYHLKTGSRDCPTCQRNAQRNPLELVTAELFARGWDLLGTYETSQIPVLLRHHKCGRTMKVQYHSIMHQGGGCTHCAKYGYDLTRPGFVYLIEHPAHRALKIGISNDPKARLDMHRRREWDMEGALVVGPLPGHLPPAIEDEIIRGWRAQGFPPALRKGDGFTETVNIDDVSRREVEALLLVHVPDVDLVCLFDDIHDPHGTRSSICAGDVEVVRVPIDWLVTPCALDDVTEITV